MIQFIKFNTQGEVIMNPFETEPVQNAEAVEKKQEQAPAVEKAIGPEWRGDWRTFEHPVIAADGYTYERQKIEEWLKGEHGNISPTTGKPLKSNALIPNLALKDLRDKKESEITGDTSELLDPVTFEIMENPVIAPEGQTFAGASIKDCIDHDHKNPITRTELKTEDLIPNRDLEAVIVKLKEKAAAKAATTVKNIELPAAEEKAPPKQSWVTQNTSFTTPEQQKFAKDWIAEVERDAKKQIDPLKRTLLLELATNTKALLKASSEPSIAKAKTDLVESIAKINSMDGDFRHVEKGKYSPGKIALAFATMGISAAIIGVRKEKAVDKTGEDITSKLTGAMDAPLRPKPPR